MAKTAVITGAGSGLGASLARKFSLKGYHVCLLGRTKSKLVETASSLKNNASIYEVDVTSSKQVKKVMESIIIEYGCIDCLVNNAGIGIFKNFDLLNEEEIHQMIDTNLKGTIFCTQHVLTSMKKQNQGFIINIVSASGKRAKETESVYSASKFGVRGFFEALDQELQHTNIKTFSVYMGNMKTDLWRHGGVGDQINNYMNPDDVADLIMDCIKPRKNLLVQDITIMNRIDEY